MKGANLMDEPKQADRIRQYVYEHIVRPARERGEHHVEVRVNQVARGMNLHNSYPAICGAIGALLFQALYDLRLVTREGPTNGSNVLFVFQID
jgi:hypothetical protein